LISAYIPTLAPLDRKLATSGECL